jgi:hypothetical protein
MSDVQRDHQDLSRRPHGRFRTLLLPALALAVISAAVGAGVAVLAFPPAVGTELTVPRYAISESTAANPSVEQVAAKVLPSVVTLKTVLGGGVLQEGSGIVLSPDGLIMTNAHVVAAAGYAPEEPSITTVAVNDGRTVPFKIVAADSTTDIAVVRAEGSSGLTAISMGSSADLRVGQQVVAVGSPLDLSGTVTVGVVSALNRPVLDAADGNNQGTAFDAIQTDAAESTTAMFGGNSNWRGPVWFPLNYLAATALERYHEFFGDELTIEYPTGSGVEVTLDVVAADCWERLVSLFLVDQGGRRPCFGAVQRMQSDPRWQNNLMFHEYFHGDNGTGLGASHQTGWTGLIADVIRRRHHAYPQASEIIQRLVQGQETA